MTIVADRISQATFDAVASEYYDPVRHPTCANFREASKILLARWVSHFRGNPAVCEVGAGKSLVAELLAKNQKRLENLMLIDDSAAMLTYSQHFALQGAQLHVARAENLPMASDSVDILASCLGDPYNYPAFWKEVARVLSSSGTVFFTSPSYEWALAYRGRRNGRVPEVAEFELIGENRVTLPSFILPQDQQIAMMGDCGLEVTETSVVCLKDLKGQSLSTKLLTVGNLEARIAVGYVACISRSISGS